ncbi:hypothetical protein ALT721_1200002 [Alteromonas alvinellae]
MSSPKNEKTNTIPISIREPASKSRLATDPEFIFKPVVILYLNKYHVVFQNTTKQHKKPLKIE